MYSNVIWVEDKGLHLNCSNEARKALESGRATLQADYDNNRLYILIDGIIVETCGDFEPLRIAG